MKFDSKIDETLVKRVKMISLDVEINKNHFCCGKSIVEVGFPDGLTINLIERNKTFIEPDGETVLVAGDKITIVADSIDTLQKFSSLIETYK
jgi:cell volume regulation protein A